jgi:hypothetical protein
VPTPVRKEVLTLLLVVVVVDALFIAFYFVAGLRDSSSEAKLTFTIIWTILTLAVVIRALSRIKMVRRQSR